MPAIAVKQFNSKLVNQIIVLRILNFNIYFDFIFKIL